MTNPEGASKSPVNPVILGHLGAETTALAVGSAASDTERKQAIDEFNVGVAREDLELVDLHAPHGPHSVEELAARARKSKIQAIIDRGLLPAGISEIGSRHLAASIVDRLSRMTPERREVLMAKARERYKDSPGAQDTEGIDPLSGDEPLCRSLIEERRQLLRKRR